MICNNCNKTIEDTALFCGFCGTPFKPIDQKELAEPFLPTPMVEVKPNEVKPIDQPAPKIPESKNNTRLWKIISSVLAIVIISFIAFKQYNTRLLSELQKSDSPGIVQNKDQQGDVTGSSPSVSNQTLLEDNSIPQENKVIPPLQRESFRVVLLSQIFVTVFAEKANMPCYTPATANPFPASALTISPLPDCLVRQGSQSIRVVPSSSR